MNKSNYIAGFITGHSVCGCNGLSRLQKEFQQRSHIPTENWLEHNFPYSNTSLFPETVPILKASLNNILHVCYSHRRAFRTRYQQAISSLFSSYDKVILLAGSCGMELLNNLDLPADVLSRMHVFAYGPVSRQSPRCASCMLVQGHGDWLSRLLYVKVHHRYPCSHLEYLAAPQTLELFDKFCHTVLQQPGRQI